MYSALLVNWKCTLMVHFTIDWCGKRCIKISICRSVGVVLHNIWKCIRRVLHLLYTSIKCTPYTTPGMLGVFKEYHTWVKVYTFAPSGMAMSTLTS